MPAIKAPERPKFKEDDPIAYARAMRQYTVCARHCPGGNRCCCDSSVYHKLHICDNGKCPCHSRARYEGRL